MTACLHPGGLKLTEKLLHMAALPQGARILDIGCGEGTTVAYLQLSGYDASGIDLQETAQPCIMTGKLRRLSVSAGTEENPERRGGEMTLCGKQDSGRGENKAHEAGSAAGTRPCLMRGDMRNLPFENESFDAVLAECSLSVCGDREAALAESMRILRPGGAILASDLFLPETDGPGAEKWAEVFARAGYTGLTLEDASACVQEFFLRYIWEHGSLPEAWKKATAGRRKVGYFLIHGRK